MIYKTRNLWHVIMLSCVLNLSGYAKAEYIRIPQNHTSKTGTSIKICFKLKKREYCIFDYAASFFEHKTLDFSNPGDRDTLIVKTISSNSPVSLIRDFGFFNKSTNSLKFYNYTFIALPGDTLNLSFAKDGNLDIKECKIKNILSDNNNPFYIRENFLPGNKSTTPSDSEKWELFYTEFNKQYDAEKGRINELFVQQQIDSITCQQFLISCQLHYYKKLFDWLFFQNAKYSQYCLPVITRNIPQIESILNSKTLFTTDEALNVMDGLVRAKLMNEGKYVGNGTNIYDEALKSNLGEFKPDYLTICIIKSPVKTGIAYQKIFDDYIYRYQNTKYVTYTDSVLNHQSEKRQLSLKDTLVTLNGASIAWNDLIKSKKKFVVIDFWASWCIPCRQQLPYIDSIRTVLKHYPIDFISVDVDQNIDDWKTVSRQIKFLGVNNYHLMGGKKATIVKKLDFKYVPRYLVLNGTKLLSSDFTQPSDPLFIKDLMGLINSEQIKN